VYELIVHDEMRFRGRFAFIFRKRTDVRTLRWYPMTTVVVPVIVMVAFSALYSGTYLWMRRESFGEGRPKGRVRRRHHH
jgi:hypothetical protein